MPLDHFCQNYASLYSVAVLFNLFSINAHLNDKLSPKPKCFGGELVCQGTQFGQNSSIMRQKLLETLSTARRVWFRSRLASSKLFCSVSHLDNAIHGIFLKI